MRPLETSKQLQGRWRSDLGNEFTLAPSRGGTLVGLYRLATPETDGPQAVAGHVQEGCVALSAPLQHEPGVVGWFGSFQTDRQGLRLELDRIIVRSEGGTDAAVRETYWRVESKGVQKGPLRLHDASNPSIRESKGA